MNRSEAMARTLCEAQARGTVGMTEQQAREAWTRLAPAMHDAWRNAGRLALARFEMFLQLPEGSDR